MALALRHEQPPAHGDDGEERAGKPLRQERPVKAVPAQPRDGEDGMKGRDLAAESMFEYGARVGFWRLHRIFTRFGVPVTIFGCARAFAANPPAAAAIAASRQASWTRA